MESELQVLKDLICSLERLETATEECFGQCKTMTRFDAQALLATLRRRLERLEGQKKDAPV